MLPPWLVWAARRCRALARELVEVIRAWRALAREVVRLLWEVLRVILLLCCLTLALWFLLWLASSASEVVALLSLLFLLDRSRSRR